MPQWNSTTTITITTLKADDDWEAAGPCCVVHRHSPSHLLVNSHATVFPDNISALVPRPTRHHAVSEVSTNLTLSYVDASWVEMHHEKGERDAAPPLTQQVVTPLNLSLWLRGNDQHTLAITWQPREPLSQGGGACRATLAEEHTLILHLSGGPASIMAVFDHCIHHG
ncbi:hypothetical protein O3P69_000071 [Scylla paramamosain]|uniref:Uncharacterized protein n=1 Tax=Scylla paramamosain TaxID=85552 RepID=A0AAW0UUI7_SCYPA